MDNFLAVIVYAGQLMRECISATQHIGNKLKTLSPSGPVLAQGCRED